MPRSEEQVDEALLQIAGERERLRAALAALPAQETRLLDQDADDGAFLNLDLDRRRSERALERLDRKEAQLVQLGERYQAEAQQAAYAELRGRYLRASEQLAEAALLVEQWIGAVNALSQECDRRGFSIVQQPSLPRVGYSSTAGSVVFEGHLAVLRNQPKIAAATPAQVPRLAPRQRTYAVRFFRWTGFQDTAYQRGQIAAFAGRDARHLVEAGAAEYMKKGMAFDPVTAAMGFGPAPPEKAKPAVEEGDQ